MGKKGGEKDVAEADLDPVGIRSRQSGADLGNQLEQVDVAKDMEVDREAGNSALSSGATESGSVHRPEMIPAPDSLSLSVQLPSPRGTLDIPQPLESSFQRTCAQSRAPSADGARCDELTLGRPRDQYPDDVLEGRYGRRS